MNLQFTIQPSPDGLAQAFIFGKELMGVRQNSLFEENVAYDSYFAAFGIGRISIRPSLRVSEAICKYLTNPEDSGLRSYQ